MRQSERRASSTSRTPSTPTNPFSVGSPPRRAMRNSFSQRLSRLVRSAGSPTGRGFRATLPGAAITVERSKFRARDGNLAKPAAAILLLPARLSVDLQNINHLENEEHRQRPPKHQNPEFSFSKQA